MWPHSSVDGSVEYLTCQSNIRRLVRPISLLLPISAASYHIYLFHRYAPELILQPLQSELPKPVFTVAAVVSGVAVGFLPHEIQKIVAHRLTGAKSMLTASARALRVSGTTGRAPNA